jgi:hypothetical protein
MKSKLFRIGALTALTCSGLFAETLLANIPFDFVMGKTAMPAGAYTVTCSNRLLTVRDDRGKHAAMILTLPAGFAPNSREWPSTGLLLFQRYGDEYFLSKVWTRSSKEGLALPSTVRQREFAKGLRPVDTTSIALSRK